MSIETLRAGVRRRGYAHIDEWLSLREAWLDERDELQITKEIRQVNTRIRRILVVATGRTIQSYRCSR